MSNETWKAFVAQRVVGWTAAGVILWLSRETPLSRFFGAVMGGFGLSLTSQEDVEMALWVVGGAAAGLWSLLKSARAKQEAITAQQALTVLASAVQSAGQISGVLAAMPQDAGHSVIAYSCKALSKAVQDAAKPSPPPEPLPTGQEGGA